MSGESVWTALTHVLELAKWGPAFAPAFKYVAPVATIATVVNPRVRAATLGLKLRWRNDCKPPLMTKRQAEIDRVKHSLQYGIDHDQYLKVVGPSGVGKTATIQNAVQSRPGVILVSVGVGKNEGEICRDVYHSIVARSKVMWPKPDEDEFCRRTVWWFFAWQQLRNGFREVQPYQRPLVVLSSKSRLDGAQFAQTTAAARTLSTFSAGLGFHVVIDNSGNSTPTDPYSSKRERTLEIGPIPASDLEAAFPDLFNQLKQVDGAAEVVREVVGGIPASLKQIERLIRELGDVRAGLDTYFRKQFRKAQTDIQAFDGERPEFFQQVVKEGGVPLDVAKDKMPSPCKVLRLVPVGEDQEYRPASPLLAFVIKHRLYERGKVPQTFDRVLAVFRSGSSSSVASEATTTAGGSAAGSRVL